MNLVNHLLQFQTLHRRIHPITMYLTLLIAVGALTALYLYLRHVYSYWERKGYPYIEPSIPLGNLQSTAKKQSSFGVNLYELYERSSGPFIGIYLLFRPALLIRDAELAKRIITSDFNYFHDRGIYCNPKDDPLSENIFSMPGHGWRTLRNKLTPTFTSGKLKGMLPTIMTVGNNLASHLAPMAEGRQVVVIDHIMSR